jgi:fatty acid desaturase
MSAESLKLTDSLKLIDPVYEPKSRLNIIERLGARLINDPRDLPFITLQIKLTLIILPLAIVIYLVDIAWWMPYPYLAFVLGVYLGPYTLMLHNASHRPLYKPEYRWLNHYMTWVIGPFFGHTPGTYFVHHIGMHHPENNLKDDLSTTMPYQRDSFGDFLRYFGRFFAAVVPELGLYLWRRRRIRLFRMMLIGEISFLLFVVVMLFVNWQATLVVFVAPMVIARFAMMAGNWAQHAFIDRDDPANCYRNSITCINSTYNRRCFNDGYHIGHHLKANRHWTELPTDFEASRERYAKERAIVFEGVDFFVVWLMLMGKQYDALAKRFVPLVDNAPSREEIVAMLKERTRRISFG